MDEEANGVEQQEEGQPETQPVNPTLAEFMAHIEEQVASAGLSLAEVHDALHELIGYRGA